MIDYWAEVAAMRRRLLKQDANNAAVLSAAYGQAHAIITARALALLEKYQDSPTISKKDADEFERGVFGILAAFSAQAASIVTESQTQAVNEALEAAMRLLAARPESPSHPFPTISFSLHRPNPAATENLIGRLSNGKPLTSLLDTLAPDVSAAIRKALVTGHLAGFGPRQIGATIVRDIRETRIDGMRQSVIGNGSRIISRMIQRESGMGLTRALTIARTETMNSYRNAALATYRANSDVATAWRWSCSFSSRTCAVCIAMDGSIHPLDEDMTSHVRCRCCPVPILASWKDLGFPDSMDTPAFPRQTGAEWLDGQSEAVRIKVLGPAKAELLQTGRITLSDLVQHTDSQTWGPGLAERSLKSLLARK